MSCIKYSILFLFTFILPLGAICQNQELPLNATRFKTIETTEGTFMNLDVSTKDGSIVFQLLGNIFLLAKNGGDAVQLTEGLSWDSYPIFSPSGDRIAFISDRTGTEQLYTMNLDGKEIEQITYKNDAYFNSIYWLDKPRSKNNQSNFYIPHKDSLVSLSANKLISINPQKSVAYYRSGSGIESYNWNTSKFNTLFHKPIPGYTTGPMISPNGSYMAMVSRYNPYEKLNKSNKLVVVNLKTSDTVVHKKIGEYLRFFPRFAFSEDSESLIIPYSGKIHRINLNSATEQVVPFKAEIQVQLAPYVYHTFPFEDSISTINHMRWPIPTSNGLVFSSLGRLYTYYDGKIKPLNKDITHGQFFPSLASDNISLLYSSWDRKGEGFVWKTNIEGLKPEKVISMSGLYKNPIWLENSSSIAFISGKRIERRFEEASGVGKLMLYNILKDSLRVLKDSVPLRNSLSYDPRNSSIRYIGTPINQGYYRPYYSVDLNSGKTSEIARFDLDVNQIQVSENQKFIAYVYNKNIVLGDLRKESPPYNLVDRTTNIPIRKISRKGGLDPIFIDRKRLAWIWANTIKFVSLNGSLKKDSTRLTIPIPNNERNNFSGEVSAYTGMRIISMEGEQVINKGTMLVKNGRITDLGDSIAMSIPVGTTIHYLPKKTIIPGFVDMHGHDGPPEDVLAFDWERYKLNLAYGITSIRDPAMYRDYQAYSLLSKSGKITAPRIFGADALTSQEFTIDSFEDAQDWVAMQKELQTKYIKIHDSWTRKQRQWLVKAAMDMGLNLTGHADNRLYGGNFNLSFLFDGFTGIEHAIPFGKLYKDVKELLAFSEIYYTLTGVNSSGEYGTYKNILTRNNSLSVEEALWSGSKEFLRNENKQTFVPDDSMFMPFVKDTYTLKKMGANIPVGSHGDIPAIEFHWEMWAFNAGGMSELKTLRSATIIGAEGLGIKEDLGSLKIDKVADFIILNANPLENIRATLDIHGIVKGGTFYLQRALLDRSCN